MEKHDLCYRRRLPQGAGDKVYGEEETAHAGHEGGNETSGTED